MNKSMEEECQRHIVSLIDKLLDNDIDSRGVSGTFIRGKFTCEFDFIFKIIDNETGEEI